MSGTIRRGFTLFEVMAAVAVLGIIITVLADASIQGMMIEGDADRRLRASLLADDALHELEGALALGQAVQLGTREQEIDDFRVSVTAAPFDPAAIGLEGLQTDEGPGGPAGPSLLTGGARGAPPLVLLSVRVAWPEGLEEIAVSRTSIGFDTSAAAPLLAQIADENQAEERLREDEEELPPEDDEFEDES